ncbi:MAG: hypothetical protein K6F66_08930 [Pseudobutyrivibrio sp.]|nr:hypothetical protein [Pseudobutyrivibrio sp.]
MAVGKFTFFSFSLNRSTTFNIVLPNDVPPMMTEGNINFNRKMKSMILLHGFCGMEDDWLTQGNAQEMASKYNMAIVIPNGYNSFYLDRKATGDAYGTFIGKDLVEYCRKTFNLFENREDSYIGGYSMGGFGALHVGLQFKDTFSKIVALSSALIIHQIHEMKPDDEFDGMANYEYYQATFGDLAKVVESDYNPEVLIEQIMVAGQELPGIYMAIGTEDFLYENNQQFKKFLEDKGVTFTYEEEKGIHDFVFWNRFIDKGINWILEG